MIECNNLFYVSNFNVIGGVETYIYNVNEFAYFVNETTKINMKILPFDGVEPDWSVEVKSYQTISAFTDSPSF